MDQKCLDISCSECQKDWSSRTFPVELPHRLIKLYSYEGDVILDPFAGSGTTAVAAIQNNRNYICYDIKPEYVDLAKNRISNQKFI